MDLVNEGNLLEGGPKIDECLNAKCLLLLVDAVLRLGQDNFKLYHTLEHSTDFGNLEADFWVRFVTTQYRELRRIQCSFSPEPSELSLIQAYVRWFRGRD